MKKNYNNIVGKRAVGAASLLLRYMPFFIVSLLLLVTSVGRLHAENEVTDPAAKDVNSMDSGGEFVEDDFSLEDGKAAKPAGGKGTHSKTDNASNNGDEAVDAEDVNPAEPPSNIAAEKASAKSAGAQQNSQVKSAQAPVVPAVKKASALPPELPQEAGEIPAGKPRPLDAVTNEYGPAVPRVLPANEFGGVPVVPGTRRNVARDEAPEQYTVEPGDTLYDICDQLIDEPNYWPKLWSLNPQIKNPHFIYPGMQLAFYPGDEDSPPFLQLLTEDEVVPIDKANLAEVDLVREDISKLLAETAAPKQTPVIGPNEISPEFQVPFEFWGKIFNPSSIDVQIPVFISKEKKTVLATVVGSETGKNLSEGADRIIMHSEQTLSPGTSYTVLRQGPDIRSITTGSFIGIRYDFVAHLNVTDNIEDGVYRGKTTVNRLGVQPNDIVVAYISTKRTVPPGQLKINKQAEDGEVIAFAYPHGAIGGKAKEAVFAQVDGQPFQEGDIVGIYHQLNHTIMHFKNDLPTHKQLIAIAYIISSSDTASVGYVVDANREVSLGDTTGGGKGKM